MKSAALTNILLVVIAALLGFIAFYPKSVVVDDPVQVEGVPGHYGFRFPGPVPIQVEVINEPLSVEDGY